MRCPGLNFDAFSDEKMRRLCRAAKAEGFTHLKMKVATKL